MVTQTKPHHMYVGGYLEVNTMHNAGGNLHFIHKTVSYFEKGTRFYMLWHLWFLPPSFFNFGSTLMLLSGCLGMQHVLNVMSRIKLDSIWPVGKILKFHCVPYKINKHDCCCSAALSYHSSVDVWYCDLRSIKHLSPHSEPLSDKQT